MEISNQILKSLYSLCAENEIIPAEVTLNDDADLFEYGVIDSMGITLLTLLIEENFGLELSPELLITELRTPRMIADYIGQQGCCQAVGG